MKKLGFSLLIIILTIFFGLWQKPQSMENIFKDKVEVILNDFNPRKIKNEPKDFILEKEFSIDTKSERILKIGLTQILLFEVDEDGCVYILGEDNRIYKFDYKGDFIDFFGDIGQGPGEFQLVVNLEYYDAVSYTHLTLPTN